jgi:hypothetical protein
VVYVINFQDREPPLWQTMIAWILLAALGLAFLQYCVAPVTRPIGEAMLKQIEQERQQREKKQ